VSELMGLYLAKPWRIMAEMGGPILFTVNIFGYVAGVPMLQAIGISLQLLSGLICTVPSTLRLKAIRAYVAETGLIAKSNAQARAAGETIPEKPFVYKRPEQAPAKGGGLFGWGKRCLFLLGSKQLKVGVPLRTELVTH